MNISKPFTILLTVLPIGLFLVTSLRARHKTGFHSERGFVQAVDLQKKEMSIAQPDQNVIRSFQWDDASTACDIDGKIGFDRISPGLLVKIEYRGKSPTPKLNHIEVEQEAGEVAGGGRGGVC